MYIVIDIPTLLPGQPWAGRTSLLRQFCPESKDRYCMLLWAYIPPQVAIEGWEGIPFSWHTYVHT